MDKRSGEESPKQTPTGGMLKTISSKVLGLADASVRSTQQDFAVWVRALRQNWRQGTVGCKGRSDVARTNKKPWKQKGTGRARAGSARSPLWRGGGVTFGPQARVRTLRVGRKQKQGVLVELLHQYVEQGTLYTLDWQLAGERPKCAAANVALKQAGLAGKKMTLFVRPDDELTFRSFRNIPSVNVIAFDQPNAVHLAGRDCLLILDKDVEQLKEMVGRWS